MTTDVITYVGLGDSYAAGVGGMARRNLCWRAQNGYPVQVARSLGVGVAYQACLGATIADVLEHQVDALGRGTAYVSITVGGNDIGFVPVLIAAAEPAWMRDSDPVIDGALATMRGVLAARLDGLYATVRDRAPDAQVVVTGYPRLFNGVEDCNLATFFSPHEMARLNAAGDELNSLVAGAAERAGFRYADAATPFVGHAVCDGSEWVNGVSWPVEGSFHPNSLGHNAYARLVADAFGAAAAETAQPQAADLPVVEGPCIPGSAPTFRLPDLLSARSLEGARAAGLDPREVRREARTLYAAMPTGEGTAIPIPRAAYAAAARLAELDAQVRAERGQPRMEP